MRYFLAAFVLVLIVTTNLFGQVPSDSDLKQRVLDLENRVAALEDLFSQQSPMHARPPGDSVKDDRMLWRKLRVGMNDDDVRQLLGEPLRIERMGGGFYTWQYSRETWHSTISFDRTGVRSWSEPDLQ